MGNVLCIPICILNFTKADQEVEGMEGMHEKPEMTIQSAELYHKTGRRWPPDCRRKAHCNHQD